MAHDRIEHRATGGGPFAKYVLTQTEEAIVRICSMAFWCVFLSVAINLQDKNFVDKLMPD